MKVGVLSIPVAFESAWVLGARSHPHHNYLAAQGLRSVSAYMHLQVPWVYKRKKLKI